MARSFSFARGMARFDIGAWSAAWMPIFVLFSATSTAAQGTPASAQTPFATTTEPTLAPPAPKDWSLTITPYLWLAGVGVDTGKNSQNVGVGDLTKLMNAAVMFNAAAQYRDFGLVVDYIFVKLSTTNDVGASSAKLDFREDILDLRGSYRIVDTRHRDQRGEPGMQLLLDMGTRYWNLDSTLGLQVPAVLPRGTGLERSIQAGAAWWDWIVGARTQVNVTERVGFGLAGNLGGFNIGKSSRFTWELTSVAMFKIWRFLNLDVGYRALQFIRDSSDTKGKLPTTKVTMSGLVLGLSATF